LEWPLFTALSSFSRDNYVFVWTTWTTLKNVGRISAAGAEVLTSFFHKDHFEFSVTSEVLAGVDRSFTSFSASAEEATLSRIFAGVRFLFDLTTGQRLGSEVADFVMDNFLTSRHRND
jgi:hypothetical protein